ncbi:hypothetical protein [Streptomyces sp. Ru87]|uniref:hypothetical protein n=1 Tax=Streptomyces sp. Ru87 TaxID=2044307 RepID=UPI00211D5847|nr:hypothetical protein [Streptomyces sp. Ru87]
MAAPPPGTPPLVEFNEAAIDVVDRVSAQLKTRIYTIQHLIYGIVTDLSRQPDDETGRVGVQTLINRRVRTVWMDLRKSTITQRSTATTPESLSVSRANSPPRQAATPPCRGTTSGPILR